jgi:cell division transport system permease protein
VSDLADPAALASEPVDPPRRRRPAWYALSGAGEAALVPQARLAGPMPWVVAIMVALTVVALAAGLALSRLAAAASAELSGGVTVQILDPDRESARAQAERAAARLRATPGVETARVVSRDQLERLLEPWIDLGGEGGDEADVPVPALVDARLDGPVDAAALGGLRRALREVAPAARVDAQSSWLAPVFSAVGALQWLAAALIVLFGGATAAAVLLAVRTALGSNRDTIEIVHLLGGTDRQIAAIFQRLVGIDAVIGGIVGFAAGLAGVIVLGRRFAALDAGLVSGGGFAWYDWLALALVPVAAAGLAILTARLTVLAALRRML